MAGIEQLAIDPYTAYIAENEGYRDTIYKDTKGKRTVGYGANIDDPTVAALFDKDVVSGKRAVTKQEATDVLNKLKERAIKDAIQFAGEDVFNRLSLEQKRSLVDMSYNLGLPSLLGFKGMKKALAEGNYEMAGKEMLDSKYAREDVPNRARRNAESFGIKQKESKLNKLVEVKK